MLNRVVNGSNDIRIVSRTGTIEHAQVQDVCAWSYALEVTSVARASGIAGVTSQDCRNGSPVSELVTGDVLASEVFVAQNAAL